MENNFIRFKCPHCGQPLAFVRPENGFGANVTCPKCANTITIKIREKAIRMPGQEEGGRTKMPRLVMTEGPQTIKRTFALRRGGNIVGRKDEDTQQDIDIEGDMTISRRSVELMVSLVMGGGFAYMAKVLNAKNPVYVNGTPLHQGNSITLRPGDTIMLGNTKLMLLE